MSNFGSHYFDVGYDAINEPEWIDGLRKELKSEHIGVSTIY